VNDGNETRVKIELWIGIAAVALLGFACVLILLPFISAALWAAILCFTTWPLFSRLKSALGNRRTLAASVATLLLSVIIAAPVAILVTRLSGNIAEIAAASQKLIHEGPPAPPAWVTSIPVIGGHIASYWTQVSISSSYRMAEIAKLLPMMQKVVVGSGRALGQGVFQIVLSLLMVWLFYRDGEAAGNRLIAVTSRIGGAEGSHLLTVAGTTMRAVVYGVLGTALIQGVLAGTGFMVAGVPGAALLGFVTFVVAVIPGGPMVVAAPAVYWLYRRGSVSWAIFVLIWAVIVGNLDNFVRPFLINRGGGTTPLILVILGVLGGAIAFGLIGLFLGPTLLAVGYSLFEEWTSTTAKSLPADEQGT
jgi:predicted PurR-regulated permease PerM